VEVTPVPFKDLAEAPKGELSSTVRQRVIAAKKIQEKRYADSPNVFSNAQMSSKDVDKYCVLQPDGDSLLKTAMERLSLSARAFVRIKKVARTIADLDNSLDIKAEHLAEAIQFRSLDRESWGS
jgi:magnesium chelatase family protein